MGLFGKKKDKDNKAKEAAEQSNDFTYSVCDSFRLKDSDDIVVVGRVNGTIRSGDAVYVSNPGDDAAPVTLTTVVSLEKGDGKGNFTHPDEAVNTRISVRLSNCANAGIKPGTVLYSRTSSVAEVHSAYVNAIGDAYVQAKQADLTDEDIERMSITDLAETWRLLNFIVSTQNNVVQAVHEENRRKIGRMAEAMVKKLFELDSIYVVINKRTNEPHLFSRTIKQDQGYLCTPPDIMVVTEAYKPAYEKSMEGTDRELRKIENGSDRKGIYNFLGNSFFVNGAQGVDFLFVEAAISWERFMPAPDYSGMSEVNIPVTNPDVERWMLLLGQMGNPKNDDEDLICRLYYRFMSKEIVKAKFIVPMKFEGEAPSPEEGDEDGKVTIKKDTKIQLAIQQGKNGRDAVRFYTDWNRLHEVYDKEWSGMIQTVDQMIDVFDIAINVTEHPEAGCYVSREMYEDMKKM